MIFVCEVTDDNKKNVFLFCKCDHLQQQTELSKNSEANNLNEDCETGDEKNILYNEISFTEPDGSNKANAWDDFECFKISQEDFFPSNVINIDTQKNIITTFLNFYVAGKLPKGLSVSDIVFAVISIIPLKNVSEEFIWHENEYRENGTLFFLTPVDKLSFEFKNIVPKEETTLDCETKDTIENINKTISPQNDGKVENVEQINVEQDNAKYVKSRNTDTTSGEEQNNKDHVNAVNDLQTFDQKNKIKLTNIGNFFEKPIKWHGKLDRNENKPLEKLPEFSPAQNSAFNTSCNKLLSMWEQCESSRIVLKLFFGIVALTLMRAIAKGKRHLMNVFSGENFRNKIKFIKDKINYTRPNESCITKCCREFKIRDRSHQIMFAKILFNGFRIDYMLSHDLLSPTYGLYNIFKMCVIDHLAYYDMGIMNLLKTIYKIVRQGVSFSVIVNDLQSDEIDHCLEEVRHFIIHYMLENQSKTLTHCWSRFFDEKKFEYLSCTKSYATAVVLAVFVENITGRADVWRSGWVKAQEEDLDEYKQLGNNLYKDYKLKCEIKKPEMYLQFFELLQS